MMVYIFCVKMMLQLCSVTSTVQQHSTPSPPSTPLPPSPPGNTHVQVFRGTLQQETNLYRIMEQKKKTNESKFWKGKTLKQKDPHNARR